MNYTYLGKIRKFIENSFIEIIIFFYFEKSEENHN
jgi:hypothetical protein